ncbi:MAG TPA: SpoIIE family protein phosphatase [Candidatus Eisenbacteria bacterium]
MTPVLPDRAFPESTATSPVPPPWPLVFWSSILVVIAASQPMLAGPGARVLRAAACLPALLGLFHARRRPAGRVASAYRVLWMALTALAAGADGGAGAPWNGVLVASLLFGLPARRAVAPWVGSLSPVRLALFLLAGPLTLAAGLASGPVRDTADTAFGSVDRALVTLLASWLLLVSVRSAAEFLRRVIRRASVRSKLVVAFGLFAITPAILVFLYATLSAWMRAGEFRATALEHELEATSVGRRWLERFESRPAPRDGEALAGWVRGDEAFLAARRCGVAVLEGRAGAWTTVASFGAPDSLFRPAAAPLADSGTAVRGLALRAGRLWYAASLLWPGRGDTLALQTLEPVDSTRLNAVARAMRCDVLLAASPTMARGRSSITVSTSRPNTLRHFKAAGGAIDIATDAPPVPIGSDSAAADSIAASAGLVLAGGGGLSGTTSITSPGGMFNAGGSPVCFAWTGSGWRRGTALTLVRTSLRETLGFERVSQGPFTTVMQIALAFFALLFVVVEIVSLVYGSRVAGLITRGTGSLSAAAGAIEKGDFSVRVSVPTQDEFGALAASFNRMAAGLEEGQRAALERGQLRRELELARRIQSRLLPASPPSLDRLDMAATNQMSLQVGGDYYDFVPTAEGRLAICIADVAGKGVAAALLMSSVKAALVSSAAVDNSPAAITTRVNRLLERSIEPGRFVTFFLAVLDPVSLRLEYVNAGHPAPMLLREDGALERLDRGGTILGIDADATFESGTATLRAGDLLAMFTDGVTEAQGEGEELFGDERIEAVLRRERPRPAADVLESLVREVKDYEGVRGQSDDLTAVLVQVFAPGTIDP